MILIQNRILRSARNVVRSNYVRSVSGLASSQLLAAALPVLVAPILGRLYTPTDYGLLASYMALSSLIVPLATLQLQHGIISEASEHRAELLVQICTLLAKLAGLISFFLAWLLFNLLKEDEVYAVGRGWLLMLPFSVAGSAISAGIATLANRRRDYKTLARIPITAVLVSVSVSLGLGFAGWAVHGLFAAYAASQAISLFMHWRLYRKIVPVPHKATLRSLSAVAARHKRFVVYTLPSEFLSTLNLNTPTYMLSALGSASLLGAYSRAVRLVGAPLTLLGQSITLVFRQRAAEDYYRMGSCRQIFLKTALALLLVGAIPMTTIMLFGPELFVLLLGPNWSDAGHIAQILAPMLLFRMVTSPVSSVFRFTEKQATAFWVQVSTGILIVGSAAIWLFSGTGPIGLLWGYSLAYTLTYAATFALAYQAAAR